MSMKKNMFEPLCALLLLSASIYSAYLPTKGFPEKGVISAFAVT